MSRALHFFPRTCGVFLVVLATLWMAGCGGGATTSTGGGNNGGGGTGGGSTGGGTGSPNITVSVSPKRAAVAMSTQTEKFIATVTEDPQNLGVTWSVDSVKGGNATVGTISSAGVYTPPASGGTHPEMWIELPDGFENLSQSVVGIRIADVHR